MEPSQQLAALEELFRGLTPSEVLRLLAFFKWVRERIKG